VVDPPEAKRLEPNVAVGDLGGLVCEATAYVDTPALLAAMRAAIIRRGGAIEEGSAVSDLWIDEGRVRGVVTDRPISCDQVVVSAGAWSTDLCPELTAAGTVVPVKGQVIILRPKEPLFTRLLKKGKTYLIPAADGRVLVGSTSEPEAGFDDSPTEEARDQLWMSAIDVVPGLAEASLEKQWVGHRPQTRHQAPYMGEVPGCSGLYLAAGHFKIGVAMGPIVGEMIRSLLCKEPVEIDLTLFQPGPR
jgi:glycine oxidase